MRLILKITVLIVLLALPVTLFLFPACCSGPYGCVIEDDAVMVPIWRGNVAANDSGHPHRERRWYDLLLRERQPDGSAVTYLEVPAPRFWLIALDRMWNADSEDSCSQLAHSGN